MLGEDYVYCHHLQTLGYKIAVETDIGFAHIRPPCMARLNLARTLRRKNRSAGFQVKDRQDALRINNERQQSAAA